MSSQPPRDRYLRNSVATNAGIGADRTSINGNNNSSHAGSLPEDIPGVDKMLSDAMKDMSTNERDKAYEEIHGVAEIVHETDDLIVRSVSQLKECLHGISVKPAFDLAWKQNQDYVTDHDFCLMFLRADCFDAAKAAARMVQFLEVKLSIWGEDKLTTRITMSDFGPSGVKALHTIKSMQACPYRDRAGRLIVVSIDKDHQEHIQNDPDDAYLDGRVFWYFAMSLVADDEETQKKGLVFIAYALGLEVADGIREFFWLHTRIGIALPVRVGAFHYCMDKLAVQPIIQLMAFGMDRKILSRMRLFVGGDVECQYHLTTYGISPDCIPLTSTNKVKAAHIDAWIKRRKRVESDPESCRDLIEFPSMNDVLVVTGNDLVQRGGYDSYCMFVESRVEAYMNARNKEQFLDGLVASATSLTRFLERDEAEDGFWRLARPAAVRSKICNSLRRLATKRRKQPHAVQEGTRRRAVLDPPVETDVNIHVNAGSSTATNLERNPYAERNGCGCRCFSSS